MGYVERGGYRPQRFEAPPTDPGGPGRRIPLGGDNSRRLPDVAKGVVLTPVDAEYQRYSELLNGFFEKLGRWQNILLKDGFKRYWGGVIVEGKRYNSSSFGVFRTHNGELSIAPHPPLAPYIVEYGNPMDYELDNPPNKVLRVGADYFYKEQPDHGDPGNDELRKMFMVIRPGRAGIHLLTDPSGLPINHVEIVASNEDVIDSAFPFLSYSPDLAGLKIRSYATPSAFVDYRFNKLAKTLTIKPERTPMTTAYQIHLFSTIDGLIPGGSTLFKTMKSGPTGSHLDNQNGTHLRVFLLSLEQEKFLLTIGENGDDYRGRLRSHSPCILYREKEYRNRITNVLPARL